jgi:hypothetical protein
MMLPSKAHVGRSVSQASVCATVSAASAGASVIVITDVPVP